MDALTIKELYRVCKAEIDNGNGDMKILISDDDEGNGFHELFCPFTTDRESINMINDICYIRVNDINEYVILG